MDFTLTAETQAICDLAARILRERSSPERLDALDANGEWFDRSTYRALAEAGLLGAALPAEVGGAGLGSVELHFLLEQVGATTAHIPVLETVALGASAIARFGDVAQQRDWLPGVVAGTTLLTAGLIEPGPADPRRPSTMARPAGDEWALTGCKSQVPMADLAARVLVPATLPDGARAVFLVDPGAAGVTLAAQHTLGQQPLSAMALADVIVGRGDRVGVDDTVLDDVLLRAWSGLASMQSGVCAAALRLTAEHARSRIQFGRPIATFQAVSQRLADAWIDADAVRLTSLQAAWQLAEGVDATEAVTIAAWWAAESGHRVLHAAHHLHGGIGIDLSYPLHRYFRLGKQIEFNLGGASRQLSTLGHALAERA
jgi:alkylation response protein AidB-like acyl-CoA dehydrogenase